jgi:acyl dehydratase
VTDPANTNAAAITDDGWQDAWKPLMARVGEDFARDESHAGADVIEQGAVRRYLEVLEFDCPLHTDPAVAHRLGHPAPTVPSTSLMSLTLPAMWSPGQPPIFTSDARNAEPERSPLKGVRPPGMPPTTAYMATDHEVDYLRPVCVGDRLARRGNRLVRCEPKATKVGRGAFTTWEYDIVDQHAEVVARCRFGMYHYDPHPTAQESRA